jgi:hypothetical protein
MNVNSQYIVDVNLVVCSGREISVRRQSKAVEAKALKFRWRWLSYRGESLGQLNSLCSSQVYPMYTPR